MEKLIFVLPFFLTIGSFAQSKFTVRDINAKGHFQIENVINSNFDDWQNVLKNDNYNFQYYDPYRNENSNNYYFGTSGNASLALNLSLFRRTILEESPRLMPHWQLALMFVRENIGNSFSQVERINHENFNNSLNMTYVNNLFRVELMRLWRTDDNKKAFVAFGIGTQFGLSYHANMELYESVSSSNGFNFNDFNSSFRTLEAKEAMTNTFFLPVDVNIKIVENLFLQLELRTGLKHLYVFDGPSMLYPIYGIGIGTRYLF